MSHEEVVEIEVSSERDQEGLPAVERLNHQDFCRIAWQRGASPPARRGIYIWAGDDYRIFYVGKATSNQTSHLYRRITAYKHATPGKTQWTSLRINSDILKYAKSMGHIRSVCLPMPAADPDVVSRIETTFIEKARPPWNRHGNPNPRSICQALLLEALLKQTGIDFKQWPTPGKRPVSRETDGGLFEGYRFMPSSASVVPGEYARSVEIQALRLAFPTYLRRTRQSSQRIKSRSKRA